MLPVLFFKKLHEAAVIPTYGSADAIGLDLSALVLDKNGTPYRARLEPGQRMLVPTGLSFAIPGGYYGRIAPRSGLAHKHGLDVMAGVIDSDYRGEIKVIVINLGEFAMSIGSGERIAQFILERADRLAVCLTNDLPETVRGEKGFGSSGVAA